MGNSPRGFEELGTVSKWRTKAKWLALREREGPQRHLTFWHGWQERSSKANSKT